MTRETLVSGLEEGWKSARALRQRGQSSSDDPARQPFELIISAMIYQRRALQAFDDERLHGLHRGSPAALDQILCREASALLETDLDSEEMVGQMHLSSAALRLPTAVYETT